jgi:hypothetical protein
MFIYSDVDFQKIDDLFTMQVARKQKLDKLIVEADNLERSGRLAAATSMRLHIEKKRKDCRRIIIFEDLAHVKGLLDHPTVRRVVTSGRHFNISLIALFQYSIQCPLAIRGSMGHIIATREPNCAYRERLYKCFFGTIRSQVSFDPIMTACCANFGVLIADNTSRSMDPNDCVFW